MRRLGWIGASVAGLHKVWVAVALISSIPLAACSWVPSGMSGKSSSEPTGGQSERAVAQRPRSEFVPSITQEASFSESKTGDARLGDSLTHIEMSDSERGWAVSMRGRVLRTTNGSGHWTDVTPDHLGRYFTAAFSGSNAWLFEYDHAPRIYHTFDGGATWKSFAFTPVRPRTGGIRLVFLNEDIGWLEWAESGNGPNLADLYRTTDGGQHWKLVSSTESTSSDRLPWAGELSFLDAKHGWLSGHAGAGGPFRGPYTWLFKTDDGGATWRQAQLPLPEGYDDDSMWATAPQWFSDGRGVLVVNYRAADLPGIVYSTQDGGQTWTRAGNVQLPDRGNLSADFVNPLHGYAVGGDPLGLLSTDDGGKTWKKVDARDGIDWDEVTQLDFVDADTGWLVVRSPSSKRWTTFKTVDGGHHWAEVRFGVR
ncbi:MAG: hypothetical protein IRZ18_00660 [Clostridia bacterium]|nr:hypothetical protein [Clostridia bacterium]